MLEHKSALKIQGFFVSYRLQKQASLQQLLSESPHSQLLQALDLRFQCMRAVAAAKFPLDKPLEDKEQVASVIHSATELAQNKGIISLEAIAQIFQHNIVLATIIQSPYYDHIWRKSHDGERDLQRLINHAYAQLRDLVATSGLSLSCLQEKPVITPEDVLVLAREIIKHAGQQIIEVLADPKRQKFDALSQDKFAKTLERMLTHYMTPSALINSKGNIALLAQNVASVSTIAEQTTRLVKKHRLPRRIVVLDADNCIFNEQYHDSFDKNVVTHNKSLLDSLAKQSSLFSETKVGCGSLRQSEVDDRMNSSVNETGSCFLAIQQIANHLKATITPLLLADIFGDVPIGTSHARIMGDYWKEHHCNWIPEGNSKLTILYAHSHHEANEHPEEENLIYFYDDLEDMLSDLSSFFKKHPEMIPINVTLHLNYYEDGIVKKRYKPIKGTGHIDPNYRQTIIDMMEITPMYRDCIDYVSSASLAKYRKSIENDLNELKIKNTLEVCATYKTLALQKRININSDSKRYACLQETIHRIMTEQQSKGNSELEQNNMIQAYMLQLSILSNSLDKMQILIHRNKTLLNQINEKGLTPLHSVILKSTKKNQVAMAHYLISEHVDLNAIIPPSNGQWSGFTALDLALQREQNEIAILLFKAGIKISPTTKSPLAKKDTEHLIHHLAKEGLLEKVQELVARDPKLIHARDSENQTPLLWAASRGHSKIVELLIALGADVNVATINPRNDHEDHNNSPLDWAIKGGHINVILALIKVGAKPNHSYGRTDNNLLHLSLFKPGNKCSEHDDEITDEEMANSAFGQGSSLFKSACRGI